MRSTIHKPFTCLWFGYHNNNTHPYHLQSTGSKGNIHKLFTWQLVHCIDVWYQNVSGLVTDWILWTILPFIRLGLPLSYLATASSF